MITNKINLIFNISDFESVSENSENKLIGGFSSSLKGGIHNLEALSNNCDGGNCATRCGSGQNISCNAVAGCGVVIKEN